MKWKLYQISIQKRLFPQIISSNTSVSSKKHNQFVQFINQFI